MFKGEKMKVLGNEVLTEKGMLKSAVAKDIKAQALSTLKLSDFTKQENGRYSVEVAEVDGKVITINLDITVGLNTDFSKKEKKTKAKEVESVEVPNLFE